MIRKYDKFDRGTPPLCKEGNILVDQLKRALSSVILNIGEGNGRRSLKERRRFFDIAIGSATEVASIFDVAKAYGYITQNDYELLQDHLLQVVKMLYKLK